jgi:transcriptional regulator with XRE-family HTH domain
VRYNWPTVLNDRLLRLGASIRAVRTALGLSQRAFADRIGRSQAYVSLLERGLIGTLSVVELDRVCKSLGATLVLGVEAPVLIAGPRQRDAAHARCVAYVARRLRADGWLVEREVPVGSPSRPGWIDIVAFNPTSRVLLVIEVKTELVDLGGLERQLGWYVREAPRRAATLGWATEAVLGCVLMLSTTATDDRLRENAPGIRQVFPLRSRDLMNVLRGGSVPRRGWFLAMIDPRSRVRDWGRPTVLDGRRTPARYRHLADFLRSG